MSQLCQGLSRGTVSGQLDWHCIGDLQPAQTAAHEAVLSQGHDACRQEQDLKTFPKHQHWELGIQTHEYKVLSHNLRCTRAWTEQGFAAHTSGIQIVEVQISCFSLDFQPPPNSHLRVLFLESGFSKVNITTTTPHMHHDTLSAP